MVTLKEGKIIDQWSTLIEQCHGEAEGFFRMVEEQLGGYQPPGVKWARESVAPGFWKGLTGKRRDFVLVRSERFDDYLMCIGGRDYGTTLDVSWYVLESTKGIIRRLLIWIPGMWLVLRASGQLKNLDVFDQQDLSAYVTVGHHSVLKAVEEIMRKRNLDVSRLERKSRGMFAIS
jgi:hypothetical protein